MGVEQAVSICQYRMWADTRLRVRVAHDGNVYKAVAPLAELQGILPYEFILAGADARGGHGRSTQSTTSAHTSSLHWTWG